MILGEKNTVFLLQKNKWKKKKGGGGGGRGGGRRRGGGGRSRRIFRSGQVRCFKTFLPAAFISSLGADYLQPFHFPLRPSIPPPPPPSPPLLLSSSISSWEPLLNLWRGQLNQVPPPVQKEIKVGFEEWEQWWIILANLHFIFFNFFFKLIPVLEAIYSGRDFLIPGNQKSKGAGVQHNSVFRLSCCLFFLWKVVWFYFQCWTARLSSSMLFWCGGSSITIQMLQQGGIDLFFSFCLMFFSRSDFLKDERRRGVGWRSFTRIFCKKKRNHRGCFYQVTSSTNGLAAVGPDWFLFFLAQWWLDKPDKNISHQIHFTRPAAKDNTRT